MIVIRKNLSHFVSILDRWSQGRNIFWILFGSALLTRAAGAFWGGFRQTDDGTYLQMAQNFLAGKGLTFVRHDLVHYSWLPPGMAVWRVVFLFLFGKNDMLAMTVFIVLLSAFTNAFFYLLAKRLFPPPFALLAALGWIVYPPQWFWASRANPYTYATNVFLICLLLLFVSWEKKSFFLPVLAGVLWATVSLMRGEYLPGIIVFVIAGFWALDRRGEFIKSAALVFLGLAIGFAPWVIRNYKYHGQFLLSATADGDNFWKSYNPSYNFSGDDPVFPEELVRRLQQEPNEIKRSEILKRDAIEYMKKNPGRTAEIIGGNFLHFWRPWLSPSAASIEENIVYVLSYLPLFFLFVWGITKIPFKEPHWMCVWGFIAYKCLVHLPFYMIVRFREAIVPLMILVAVLPVQKLWESRKER